VRQAVILAGGKGTRLKDISGDLPKSMVPILGKPLLQHLIEQCVEYQIFDIKLLVSYKKEFIERFFGDGSRFGVSIQYIVEPNPRGTAGALIDALPELNDQFLVVYGDTFFDIDLGAFWDFHQIQAGDVSIFLHPNDHPYDSDLVEIDQDLRVKKIHPYPHDPSWRQNLVNAAVYIFNKSSLKNITFSSVFSTPDIAKNLFPLMLEQNKQLFGYISTEYIKDMGTPRRLSRVEKDIQSGKVRSLNRQAAKVAIFLDRDGTINKEVNHLSSEEQFEILPSVGKAIAKINEAGILVIVVTNQPVIARGDLTEDGLKNIHNKMDTLLGLEGAYIDRLYYCPHHPDSGFHGEVKKLKLNCDCRKPNIGLFIKARNDINVALEESWMVGDSFRDIGAAKNAGILSVLVGTGFTGRDARAEFTPDFEVGNLEEAVDLILGKLKK
jgi:histidinol-phosphate phosphatase family protein